MATTENTEFDYVIVGSGFGGSVSALRLSQKGYRVLVIEKGQWFSDDKYARSAWDLKRWLWIPMLGLRGIMKLSIFRHVTVYSGVGVGGGSLTYGATLPTPKSEFFNTGSWSKLQDWEQVLKPFYRTALKMLGATDNPRLTDADLVIKQLAINLGKEQEFHPSRVGIFFSDKTQERQFEDDPYFDGQGPRRSGCIECGSCMTGCGHNAKNTLDKNYLYLAQKHGAQVLAEHEVLDVSTWGSSDGSEGYDIHCRHSNPYTWRKKRKFRAKGVIFAGGVLGTVPLLLNLKHKGSLPALSAQLGSHIRTNNETITTVTSFKPGINFAQGVTIGSVLHTDDNSHLEPINQNSSAGLMRILSAPRVSGSNIALRLLSLVKQMLTHPIANLRVLFTRHWGQKSIFLLFMQHLDSTLTMQRGLGGRVKTTLGSGPAPSCHIPESEAITDEVESIVQGKASIGTTEALLGTPSTAHILGGAVMGESVEQGVINHQNQVFGYENMYICDGSAISANPGVNPSLSITAISEWAMSHIPPKHQA